ncbi:Uma2 family endonuclease [Acidobacterium sp. S8]|uniref:Uma2 family endonuclease n=1 Tax=Acidobacterium sp. S8 TaxID=1641854 RepID=UPI00131B6141|nr:Uma2 family endonuclease [Acidobacterium sp. S8]
MATSTHVPIEVYLRSSYEPDAEYVDGEIEERPVGERDHAAWRAAIVVWFFQHSREWNITVLPELRVQAAASRFRVPDVAVLDSSAPVEQITTHAPLAVFEVLSPEDTVKRLKHKLEDYAAMGIPQIWVIDPEDGSFSRYENKQLVTRDRFDEAGRGISFEVGEIGKLLRR